MFALYERDHKSGTGQGIDLSVLDPIFTIRGDQAITSDPPGHRKRNPRSGKYLRALSSLPNPAGETMLSSYWAIIRGPWKNSLGRNGGRH
jgi:hypothetical protein